MLSMSGPLGGETPLPTLARFPLDETGAAGTALLIASGALAAMAGHGAVVIAVALTLLGVGWNSGLIAGSTLLASAVPLSQRPRAEGATYSSSRRS